jgi:hypothetical protein
LALEPNFSGLPVSFLAVLEKVKDIEPEEYDRFRGAEDRLSLVRHSNLTCAGDHLRCTLSDNRSMHEPITRDPDVMHGTPVDFLEGFPTVSRELAVQVLEESRSFAWPESREDPD